jgi:probable rRNA maturation factor|tara:strand:- start:27 stop:467 length:441 start_codon:yes stop_codon:yes gene_type:complete
MIRGNVFVDFPKWKNKIKNPEKYLLRKIKKLQKISYFKSKNQEFSILLTNSQKMKKLNFKFRKKNKITDVLSFPLNHKTKKNIYIGDIAIGFEIINKRSKVSDFSYEFDKMWIHGYLHLIGYDHKKNKEYAKMSKKEKLILNYLHC